MITYLLTLYFDKQLISKIKSGVIIMKKVAVYVRVSTEKQEEQNQIAQLEEYCKKSDYEIFKIYQDKITGKSTNRKQFDLLFKEAHQKQFDIVLVWKLDRFSRAGISYTLQKLKELDHLGIGFISYQEEYLNTSSGHLKDLVLSILSYVASIEAENISVRTKAGLERVRKEGKILGRPKLRIDQEQIKNLRKEGLSYREIADKLKVSYVSIYNSIRPISLK